jgi:RsiW-degrading membrane proteinase PrsW (M82 family)
VNALLAFALAAAPALLLLRYYYRQDRARPEPKGLVFRVFLAGVLVTLFAIPLELLVGSFEGFFSPYPLLYAAFRAFVVAALVEEFLKRGVVLVVAFRHPSFDETVDGVVYAVVASLGFACLENIMYVMGGTLATALVRAVTAVPLHATASGMMGYFIGQARFARSPVQQRALLRRGLTVAVLIHGLYNFLLFAAPVLGPLPILGIVPLLLGSFFVLRGRIRLAIADDQRRGRVPASA